MQFSDTARLLSFYQLWLDDLFPKARFLDALSMVEKTGHKTSVLNRRRDWIAEEKRRAMGTNTESDQHLEADTYTTTHDAPDMAEGRTPPLVDLEGDGDDIYNASPRTEPQPPDQVDSGQPGDDDLEALMMEADNDLQREKNTTREPEPEPFADEEAVMAEMGDLW